MKLYVINLERSPDRLSRLEKIFRRQKLALTCIKAIDARVIGDAAYHHLTEHAHWPEPMTRGEIACFLSHRLALEQVATEPEAYGAIFEDDITLSARAHLFLENENWIPPGADIVKLETQGKKIWLGPPAAVADGFTVAELKSSHIMAAAYIVSKQAAAYLVGKMASAYAPFDHFLFNFDYSTARTLRLYQLDPAIVIQAPLASTLEHERAQHAAEKKHKRRLPQTLHREMRRIAMRSRIGLWGLKTNLFTTQRWKRVNFDKEE